MHVKFNEAKATQAAARFLELRGAPMSYMKLVKLLYLADREALLRWGRPITTDCYVSMDRGPVVSRILDLITDEPSPGQETIWSEFVSRPVNYEVQLLKRPSFEELSRAEDALIQEIFERFGRGMNRWQLVEYTHTLPEWKDPGGGALPIEYRDILRAGGKTSGEIAEIENELENLALLETFLPS